MKLLALACLSLFRAGWLGAVAGGRGVELWDPGFGRARQILPHDEVAEHTPRSPTERDVRRLTYQEMFRQYPKGKVSGPVRRIKGGLSWRGGRPRYSLGTGTRANISMLESSPIFSRPTIAIYPYADSNIAISVNRQLQCVLELSKFFGEKEWTPAVNNRTRFEEDWMQVLSFVQGRCECEGGECPRHFGYGIVVLAQSYSWVLPWIGPVVDKFFRVDQWVTCDHHYAHAMMAYHSSPFRSAVVISYDGGGNDGTFKVYYGHGLDMRPSANFAYNFGVAYSFLGALVPEVSGVPLTDMCAKFRRKRGDTWTVFEHWHESNRKLWSTLPGKLMGYTALGNATLELRAAVRAVMELANGAFNAFGFAPNVMLEAACGSLEQQRALAASIQEEFKHVMLGIVTFFRDKYGPDKLEGVVMTGGCALNVLTNQAIHDELSMDVYVPPAPGDSGLTAGAVWTAGEPLVRRPMQYLGFGLIDAPDLAAAAAERGARDLTALGGVEYLAELLTGGPAWQTERLATEKDRPIVGVVRGRHEFGPRALGHRSLFAALDSQAMKDRMNRLKVRAWYRPVAPILCEEDVFTVFGKHVPSPYMSMAPRVQEAVRERYPGLVHLDGTARHQSVRKRDEPWLHSLLHAVRRRTGLGGLINTSFNTKGKPILNRLREALRMLDELPDLDYVLVDDWLFKKPG